VSGSTVAEERSGLSALGSRQVSRVIYGAIIGLALIVGLENHPPSAGVMLGTLLATAVAVGLAEAYSDVVGAQTRTRERVRRAEISRIFRDAIAVAFGVGSPAIFFILAAAGAIELESAFTIAKWSGLGLLGFYGFHAARRTGATPAGSLLQALAVALIGAFLIAFKALIH
jgi:hypothetical protein